MLRYRSLLYILIFSLWASTVQGQDLLRDQRIRSLKGLKEVAILFHPNVLTEVLPFKEIVDTLKSNLKQLTPELDVKRGSKNWLVLSYVTNSDGGFVEISLYRWVTVSANGENVYAKVWDDKRIIFGQFDGTAMTECIDTLFISFSKDFIRGNYADGKTGEW